MYNGFVLTENLFEVEHVFVFLLRIMCLCVHFSSLQSPLHPFCSIYVCVGACVYICIWINVLIFSLYVLQISVSPFMSSILHS